jgi:D-glycero-beta-D-manno-heptose 1-phosphate adenylyltransferase
MAASATTENLAIMSASLTGKIADGESLAARVASLPRPLVFTNGVFDILHGGHVTYLHAARQLGASLVVGLNTDESVRKLNKGDDRPLNKQADRALVLAALESVSLIAFFAEATPVALLQQVKPEVYVKGGDYQIESLEETRVVRSWGGRAVAIAFMPGYSTTDLVQRIRTGP